MHSRLMSHSRIPLVVLVVLAILNDSLIGACSDIYLYILLFDVDGIEEETNHTLPNKLSLVIRLTL